MKNKLIHEIRAVKNKTELANIVKAQRIAERVLVDVLKKLRTGITELEVQDFICASFTKYGAPVLSFPPIVAFGKNTANIHHEPGKSKLKRPARRGGADTVMLDFGCTVNHYCSDMTRTYFWGEPSAKQKKIYLAVLEAQERALAKLAKGEKNCKKIDSSARDFLNKKFPKNFQHGLGHGVGTVIHEWPNFKPKSTDILPAGCVMTIEPGLYFPGFAGVRIEDMALITKSGCVNLTHVPKSFESAILSA